MIDCQVSQQEDESAVELEGRSRSRSLERAERGRTSVSGILGGRTSMSKSPLSGATQPLLSRCISENAWQWPISL